MAFVCTTHVNGRLSFVPTAPVVVVNAGAISPLVALLTGGAAEVKEHAFNALSMLAIRGATTKLAIASGLVMFVGTGSAESQEQATMLLLHLAQFPDNCKAIANAGAAPRLVAQLKGGGRTSQRAQELAAAVLAYLSSLEECVRSIVASNGIRPLVGMLSPNSPAAAHAAAVLSAMARTSVRNQRQVISEGAIWPLVNLLVQGKPRAKAEAAGALLCLTAGQPATQRSVAEAGAIKPLIQLLGESDELCLTKAAGAVAALCKGSVDNQDAVEKAKGIGKLVALLKPPMSDEVNAEAAAALAVLADANAKNQHEVADAGGIEPLVALLEVDQSVASQDDKVEAEIEANATGARAREEAAAALWALALHHRANQIAIAEADGIARLVAVLGVGNERAQDQAAGALSALALENTKNEHSIAQLIVALLGSKDPFAMAKAARAISGLARANASSQRSIASAGGIELLVSLLAPALSATTTTTESSPRATSDEATADPIIDDLALPGPSPEVGGGAADNDESSGELAGTGAGTGTGGTETGASPETGTGTGDQGSAGGEKGDAKESTESLRELHVLKEVASAIWSMANGSEQNQIAVATAGGVPPLVALLHGHSSTHRAAAGALWALASHPSNQEMIAREGGVAPLVKLLKTRRRAPPPLKTEPSVDENAEADSVTLDSTPHGSRATVGHEALETAAGALSALANTPANRHEIAEVGGIPLLIALFDGGSEEAKEQAALALQCLVRDNTQNQLAVVNEAVAMLRSGSAEAQEHTAQLVRNLAQDPDNRTAIAKAGAVPELVRQLECGSEKAMGMAASGLALIALSSEKLRALVSNELVKLLSSDKEAVRQRAAEALTDMVAGESANTKHRSHGVTNAVPLVNLLKDGLKDGRVEAQEYALRSLLSISDVATKEQMVQAGCIQSLTACLAGGKLSATAQEHAAAVVAGIAPLGQNAIAIKEAKGIAPLVELLSNGTADAKGFAADALAQLARRANASSELARAGAVSAFVRWLADAALGPPEVAARALSEIAEDNEDAQAQIAEEGAIQWLVEMVGAWKHVADGAGVPVTDPTETSATIPTASAPFALPPAAAAAPSATGPSHQEDGASPPTPPSPEVDAALGGGSASTDLAEAETRPKSAAAIPSASAPASAPEPIETDDPSEPPGKSSEAADGEAASDLPMKAVPNAEVEDESLRTEASVGANAGTGTEADAQNGKEEAVIADSEAKAAEEEKLRMDAEAARVKLAAEHARARAAKKALSSALKTANVAAGALATLAKGNLINQITVTEEGGIPPLVELLKTTNGSTRSAAAGSWFENPTKALWHLAEMVDNQTAISRAGGISPLVTLLTSESEITQQYAAAALQSLAREHPENQITIAKTGAIAPLIDLLGSDTAETQEHTVGVLLHLASHDITSRNAVVRRLVSVLTLRNAAPQLKATEALMVLAARSDENRKAITSAGAIEPLVALMGDGRRVRRGTPQAGAAAVLADLARSGDNKQAICSAGAIGPLVSMLSADSIEAQTHAAAALAQLAALTSNRKPIADQGAIRMLVALLDSESSDAQKFATGALWHLASSADNKTQMVTAGIIPLLLPVLHSKSAEAREHACAVFSSLARTQGGNKKAIYNAGGIEPLVELLSDARQGTQRHAASALWGLSEGKDGIYDRFIAEAGAIQPLVGMLRNDEEETRGFATACLLCICKDPSAHSAVLAAGAVNVLQRELIAHGQTSWLGNQVTEMLTQRARERAKPGDRDALRLHFARPPVLRRSRVSVCRSRRAHPSASGCSRGHAVSPIRRTGVCGWPTSPCSREREGRITWHRRRRHGEIRGNHHVPARSVGGGGAGWAKWTARWRGGRTALLHLRSWPRPHGST